MNSDISLALQGLHHITVPVTDLDVAQGFYVDLLGATLCRRMDRAAFLRFNPARAAEADGDNSPFHVAVRMGDAAGPELHLFLQRGRPKPMPPPHPHLAVFVAPAALDGFAARLAAAGVPLDGPRRLGPPGQASLYFADPFGNTLELVTTDYRGNVAHGAPDVSLLGW